MKKKLYPILWCVASVHVVLLSCWFGGLNGLGLCTASVTILSVVAWLMGCSHGVKIQQKLQIDQISKNYGPSSPIWRG